jgi:pyruvate/2-oxoglutarate dehydrogenase complex dihydrolipoamide dehydrogenase (E3) component
MHAGLEEQGRQSRQPAASGGASPACCAACASAASRAPAPAEAAMPQPADSPMDFDLAVIGAGSAGLSVAAGAAQLGARVALIERGRMGGDCLNTGCVPSKALLAAAHAARAVREAGRFGVIALEPIIDWDRLRAHVQGVVAAIAPTDSEARYRALGATVLRGEARFLDPATLSVDGRQVTARRFVVAAGSRAALPPIPGLDQVPYWTNDTLFDLAERPDHLLILGGGPVGLEMADAFCGLGCAVTVVEAARIAPREDPELAAGLRRVLARRGVAIREGVTVARVASGPVLVLSDGSRISGSHLLVATGRTPNIEALDLPAAGVRADAGGIVTDRGLRSVSNRRVFAAGDIANPAGLGPRAFTHVGSYHAGIIIRRVLFRLPARLDYTALPRVIYTDPNLAQTGLTEAEAVAAGLPVRILRWPLAQNDRAVAERDTDGLVKLVAVRGRIVGAGILAPQAGEMITAWSLAIARRTRLSALAGLIVPYPTRSEAAKRAATGAFMARLLSPGMKSLVRLLARLP